MDLISRLLGIGITTIAPDEAHQRLKKKPRPVLIDVRQPSEFREGHVPGARSVPLSQLKSRMGDLPRNQEIFVICASGHRSILASRQLKSAGYQVVNIDGGTAAWSRAKLPLTQ